MEKILVSIWIIVAASEGAFASSIREFDDSDGEISSQEVIGKILCVDDGPVLRMMLVQKIENALENRGLQEKYEVDKASNGQEAIDMATKYSYKVIFMDMQMPKVNGIKATHEIKQANPNVVIIRSSTLTEEEVVEESPLELKATILGLFDGVIAKTPFVEAEIQYVLEKFLPNSE